MGFGSDKTAADLVAPQTSPFEGQHVSFGKKILYYLWDSDQHLKSPAERHLLRKLDAGILLCACLGWFMKYIDQANLSNAYVSGMKEDLDIQGNEYTYMQTTYIVGFAIMQIPSSWIALKIRPSWWLFACEIGWGTFTFAQAGARNPQMMYFFRFMVGFFESAFSPVIIFLLGSWYTKPELAKRVAIWHLTGFVGSACSGFLQAAIYNTMDGRHGLAGWRWLYVICGIMTMPVAIMCLFVLPDYPHTCRVWYITEEERQMAIQRCANVGRVEIGTLMNWSFFKRLLTRWRFWMLIIAYIFYGNSCQANSYFAIYLKFMGYSVNSRNIIPACANLVSALTVFLWGFGSDITRNRFWWIVIPLVLVQWSGNAILAIYPSNEKARFAAFFIIAGEYITCVFWTWANEICAENAEERALTIAAMNGFFYAFNAWIPNVIFQQTMGPTWRRGFPATWAFGVCAVICVVIIQFLHNREIAQKLAKPQTEKEIESQTSSEDVKEKATTESIHDAQIPNVPAL
ncbi:MFS general substrate transporter [Hymenopellis radicata]|nr:MFS general substrate transporter [Hymenopellis radicata]